MRKVSARRRQRCARAARAAAGLHLRGEFLRQTRGRAALVLERMAGFLQPLRALRGLAPQPRGRSGEIAAGMVKIEDLPARARGQPRLIVARPITEARAPRCGIALADALPFAIQALEELRFR